MKWNLSRNHRRWNKKTGIMNKTNRTMSKRRGGESEEYKKPVLEFYTSQVSFGFHTKVLHVDQTFFLGVPVCIFACMRPYVYL